LGVSYIYGFPHYEITRPFFFIFSHFPAFPFYIASLFFFGFCFAAIKLFYRRQVWLSSTNDKGKFTFTPFKSILNNFILHFAPGNKSFYYIFQKALVLSVIFYFISGSMFFLNNFILLPLFSINILNGYIYLLFTFITDLAVITILVALASDIILRIVVHPESLVTDMRHLWFHIHLIIIVVTGTCVEGIRIALTGIPIFEKWSFIGYNIANLFVLLPASILEILYIILLTIYIFAILILVTRLTSTKFPGNIYPLFNLSIIRSDIEIQKNEFTEETDFSNIQTFNGKNQVTEFNNTTLRSCDACIECGTCHVVCPAVLAESNFSPRDIIIFIKNQMSDVENGKSLQNIIPTLITSEELYSCYDCGICNEVCPTHIKPLSIITELKKFTSSNGKLLPYFIAEQYRNIEFNNTIYKQPVYKKNKLLLELNLVYDVKITNDYDYLLFVGCNHSSSEEQQQTVINFLKLCKEVNLKVGILGDEEKCCGDTALRTGNMDLFKKLASHNIHLFHKYGITKIITMCPHGYDTLKKAYKDITKSIFKKVEHIEIIHYSEILLKIIENGKLILKRSLPERVVVHDSCFLGRFNNQYSIPRKILQSITGTDLVEMKHHGQMSLCCGSSGGVAESKKRIAYQLGEIRAMEGITTGASIIATTCPYCFNSISEGIRDIGQDNIIAKNIADLVCYSADLF
jgi:Fe-S oxidoreductase